MSKSVTNMNDLCVHKEWKHNGQYHREDGPAIKWSNGMEYWMQYDIFHREDGAALTIGISGVYYLFGVSFTEEEFWKRVYHD